MPRITVTSLQNATTLQDLQSNHILLQQPSIIDLAIEQNQIAQIEHVGPRLIIVLKNGEQITIDNFFTAEQTTPHTLLLRGEHATKLQAHFDNHAQLIDYSRYEPTKVVTSSSSYPAATTTSTEQQTAPLAQADEEQDKGPSFLKIGLALAALEATYLVAFNKDKKTTTNTPLDLTPPTISSGGLDDAGKVVTGVSTKPNVRVYAVNQAGQNIGETTADANGKFTLHLSEDVINGALVTIKAVDQSGNESKAVVFRGDKDTIPPAEANAQINDQGLIISGKAEPNAKVKIYAMDGTTLIAGPVYAAKDGSFSVSLKTALKLGEKAQVMVEDAAGNQSKMVTVEVGKDTLAPEQPLIEVAADGSSIKGISEANAKISIFNSSGQLIGTTQADAMGKFNLALTPALIDKSTASIVAEDAAGNKSPALNFKAGDDTIAPDTPVASINADGNLITGTAEANSKIEVYNLQGSVIGTTTTDADGKFSLTLKNALVNNTHAKVYAIDHAGNKSPALEVIGSKDTIPPTKVVLKAVTDHVGDVTGPIKAGDNTDDARPVFDGTGEANAILTIYNFGHAIGTVKVNANSTWSFRPDTDLPLGKQNFTFTQMDASNNTSDMSDSFQFNVVAVQTPATLLLNLLNETAQPMQHLFNVDSAHIAPLTTTENQEHSAATALTVNQLLTSASTPPAVVTQVQPDHLYHLPESTELKADVAQLLYAPTTFIA